MTGNNAHGETGKKRIIIVCFITVIEAEMGLTNVFCGPQSETPFYIFNEPFGDHTQLYRCTINEKYTPLQLFIFFLFFVLVFISEIVVCPLLSAVCTHTRVVY